MAPTYHVCPAPHHLHPDSPVRWFLMQARMIAGFFTAWSTDAWLIRTGIKEAMEEARAALPSQPPPTHPPPAADPGRQSLPGGRLAGRFCA
jgi:hypothetical protein